MSETVVRAEAEASDRSVVGVGDPSHEMAEDGRTGTDGESET